MTIKPTALRIRWDANHLGGAEVIRPSRGDDTLQEAWGTVTMPNGKSYRVAAYRFRDAPLNGTDSTRHAIKMDCAIYVHTGGGSRMLPESNLPEVRAFILAAFRIAVQACADSDWDTSDHRWPACDPMLAAVAEYDAAIGEWERALEVDGAKDSDIAYPPSIEWHKANAKEHRETHDWRGLFDISATRDAITTVSNLTFHARARAAGYAAGKSPVVRENPHNVASPQYAAWREGYAATIETGETGDDWEPTPETKYYAQRRTPEGSKDGPFAFGPTVESAVAALKAGERTGTTQEAKRAAPLKLSQGEALAAVETPPVRTVDCTPDWRGILPLLLAALTDGTAEGRKIAREELQRMADVADKAIAYQKQRDEQSARAVTAEALAASRLAEAVKARSDLADITGGI